MARLDKEQWAIIRERWESDPRTGYAWVIAELGLTVTSKAVELRVKNEGWLKSGKSVSGTETEEAGEEVKLPVKLPEEVGEEVGEEVTSKKPVGRPTKFKEDYINQAYELALLGCTDEEMAEVFEVALSTFKEWKDKHSEFRDTISAGKVPADAKVATAAFDSARGYAHEDVHISNFQGQITLTPIVKHYPPSFQALSFWLRNRQPEKWRKDRVVKDQVINPFPDIAALDEIKRKGLERAMQEELKRRERREKLGINISGLLTGSDEI